ncbi:hypothetical protein DL96DRAFT_1689674 [Flagelloscypha sp. PMI_526]|nr:hypothetical protein DL96DRAFT_1689674 [Flagelloscypha sp. PMI_526]
MFSIWLPFPSSSTIAATSLSLSNFNEFDHCLASHARHSPDTSPILANASLQPRQGLTLLHATTQVVPDRCAHAAAAVWPLRRRECPVVSLGIWVGVTGMPHNISPGANSSVLSLSSFSAQSHVPSPLRPPETISRSLGSDIG